MRKRILLLSGLLIIMITLWLAVRIMDSNMEQLTHLTIESIDLAGIPDGTYTGSYTALPISAKVRVVVKNQQLAEIEIERHFNGQGSLAETILDTVIEEQSINVDIVSGATYSSMVILKAIENALCSAT